MIKDPSSVASPTGAGQRTAALLEVKNLSVSFRTRYGLVRAVNGLDLRIDHRERVGIVGESGSGKSVTALSILGLLRNAVVDGEIWFDGTNILTAPAQHLRDIRGQQIGYIFQDPLSALNPVKTIGDQITETLRIRDVRRGEARDRAIALLDRVGITNARDRMDDYPHQFSGGMRQRVMIAMALIAQPKLVIADEPTTALDVRVQAQVLDLLRELAEEQQLAVLFITHDLGILAGFTERVVVMYAGKAMERCSTDELFYGSINPYTLGLLQSLPRIDGALHDRLVTIGGQPPSPSNLPSGCPFHPRCRYAEQICREKTPALVKPPGGRHPSACHLAGWLAETPGQLR